jgi:hypothetical protein
VTFIFDPSIYDVLPDKVVVTGAFRNWDGNMDNPLWQLYHSGELWVLKVTNADFETIQPNTKFKFRINHGEWIQPPTKANNEDGGDLIFMKTTKTKDLNAELLGPTTILAKIIGERPLLKSAYKITDAEGNEIPIASGNINHHGRRNGHQTCIFSRNSSFGIESILFVRRVV